MRLQKDEEIQILCLHNILRLQCTRQDTRFYGEIPDFDGVYANAETPEDCREELEEVLEEWILLRVSQHLPLPIVDGLELTIKQMA